MDAMQKDLQASAKKRLSKSEREQIESHIKAQPLQNLTPAQKLAMCMIEEIKSLEGEK